MAINWDSIQPNPNGFAAGLGGIAEAFRARRERELRQKQMEMQAALEREQMAQQAANQGAIRQHEQARLASEEERARAKMEFDRQQAEQERNDKQLVRAQDTLPKVSDAFRAKRYSEAELLARGAGIAMMPEQRPQDPGQYRPQAPPQRPEGPVNIDAQPEDVDRQIQAREQYNRDNTNWIVNELDAEEEHGEKQRAFQEGKNAEPAFHLSYGGKPWAVLRGGEMQAANEAEGERVGSALGDTSQTPQGLVALQKYAAEMAKKAVASGAIKQEGAAAFAQHIIDNAEQRRIAEINANRPRGGDGWRKEHGEARLDVTEWTAAKNIAQTVFQNLGFKETQTRNRKFNNMADQLANPNAALDAMAAGTFVKEAQGGTGVISDADMEAFWNRIGGVTTRTSQWVQNVLDGTIEQGKRATVTAAVKWLASRAQQNLAEIRGTLEAQYETAPEALRKYGPGIVRSYFEAPQAAGKPAQDGKSVDSWLDSL